MRLGICCDADQAKWAQRIGYEFVELSATRYLSGTREDFESLYEQLEASSIRVDAFNCFLPGDLKIAGPSRDLPVIEAYLNLVLPRAKALGAELIVFGSGGARSYPEGFPQDEAMEQIKEFLAMVGRYANFNDLLICLEPLQSKECNTINTLREASALIQDVGEPSLRLTLDLWHMHEEGESYEVIGEVANALHHVHAADTNRLYPGSGSYDFRAMFRNLRETGYAQRISCEFSVSDFNHDAACAYAFLTKMLQE
ncbi:MAG: sugar phosphate isomerase/epimerase family protein [Limnochordia bacterium]|jgi:sugar phosphate isomerase/epimerase